MEERKDILWRVYLVYILCCVFALAILGRVFFIQVVQGEKWKKEAENFMIKQQDIEAVRGSIYAADGSLLATSLPYYEVGIDPLANSFIEPKEFADSAKALSKGLADLLSDRTSGEYYRMIMTARKKGLRYQVIARNVSYKDLQEMKKLPLFRAGRYKGGFIYIQTNRRERPFRQLAARTIGYISDSGRVRVGLEGAYDSVLTGISGKRLMRKIAGGVWMPVNNDNEIEPQHGKDIVTTIDINIQDVAENALQNSLIEHNAKYGCVVLMEVQTGAIKAIANLTRRDSGVYEEDFNYAIADAREPGSTFKLASLLVAMDDGYVTPKDNVNLNGGEYRYFDRVMKDSHPPKKNEVTVEEAFWESSNVGISRTVWKAYSKDPKKFTDGLQRLSFGKQLGLSIPGEGKSKIKTAGAKDWYGTSLPWMSIGYESLITPLQTLTLYNAVANDGKMVKPMLVKEIRDKGKTVVEYQPEIINPAICKPQTIKYAKNLLEGVVQNGTAKSLKNANYLVAGKTGTAQVAQKGSYKGSDRITYQASFVGYFPADKPRYSCIVIVNAPSNDAYYGGVVAGPIFKQIADRVYASAFEIHNPVFAAADSVSELPVIRKGLGNPTIKAAKGLQIQMDANVPSATFLKTTPADKSIKAEAFTPEKILDKGQMPDVTGMNSADAIYLFESRGYKVRIKGVGAVKKQSRNSGEKINKNEEIILELGI
ncbi:MAG: penicillin-binding protein [Bacteroidia bacterium]